MEATPRAVLNQVFVQLEERLGSLRGLRLLDYGCGIGPLLRVALDFGLQATGVEPNPEARQSATAICHGGVYANIEALRATESGVRFDLITLWNVIEHLRQPWVDLRGLRDFLAPNGSLLVSTMNIRCLRARAERERWENYWNPTHFYYFDRKSLERVINYSGFLYAAQWKPKIRFPHHGLARRWLYGVSTRLGVADGLYYICP